MDKHKVYIQGTHLYTNSVPIHIHTHIQRVFKIYMENADYEKNHFPINFLQFHCIYEDSSSTQTPSTCTHAACTHGDPDRAMNNTAPQHATEVPSILHM